MTVGEHIWGILSLSAVFALAAALYGMAALWVLYGPKIWLLRWSPLVLLLAALAPLAAYPLIIFYGAQAIALIAGIAVHRALVRRRMQRATMEADAASTDEPWPIAGGLLARVRFTLSDLLQIVLLVCAVLAIVRFAAPEVFTTLQGPSDFARLVAAGAGLGTMQLAVISAMFGDSWRRTRTIALFLSFAGFSMLLELCSAEAQSASYMTTGLGLLTSWPVNPFIFVDAAGMALFFAALLKLAAATGWIVAERTSTTMTRLARLGFTATATLGLAFLIHLYGILLPPNPSPPSLPVPNGYDDLIAAAKSLNWAAISSQDYETAGDDAVVAFAAANKQALALVRTALTKQSRVPIEWSMDFSFKHMPDFSALLTLCRAMKVESLAASHAGQHFEAAQIDLDLVRVGNELSRGGLIMDDLGADALISTGAEDLADHIPVLSTPELEIIRKSIESLIAARDSLETFEERDRLNDAVCYGWLGRLWQWAGFFNDSRESARGARNRSVAQLQLLVTEAAIRQRILTEGSPPDSLESLVPKYLSTVPQDPLGNGPLVYRRQGDGYLLYSVGPNGVDDGGNRVSLDKLYEIDGDLFFDAKHEYTTAQNAQQATDSQSDETPAVDRLP